MKKLLPRLFAVLLLISFPALADDIIWQHPFDMGEEAVSLPLPLDNNIEASALPAPPLPKPARYAHRPMVAVVIDDMGLDRKRSEWALHLPAGVTLAYLPYAPKVAAQAKMAKEMGHEVILHLPMEAKSASENPGPHHLAVGMSAEELEKNIAANLDAFEGYDGVNNHMGSRFTRYRQGLEAVMAALQKRHVFFLDSRTTPESLAEQVAREHHLPAAGRDIFIDHAETAEFVAAALNHAEDIARATGSAIAIGHPKDVTIASLEVWLEGLKGRGIDIVPLSEVVRYRNRVQSADNK
jgi:polysaccharide deacetylase 2 family uncharacterized protein YibQ